MGKVEYALVDALVKGIVDFVEEYRQYYRYGETENQAVYIEKQGVPEDSEKIHTVKKLGKMLEPHPRAAFHAQTHLEILKGYPNTVHGHVFKNHKVCQRNNHERVEPAIPEESFRYAVKMFRVDH
jgi:hypothetical protein